MLSKERYRDLRIPLLTTAVLVLANGGWQNAAEATPHVFLSPPASSLGPGESVTIEVFIDDVADLRLYEVVLEVTGDEGGALDLTDLVIDEDHDDFVFVGFSSLACLTDPDNLRITCTPLSGGCVDVPANTPAYLGSYTFTANTGTSMTFDVNIVEEPSTFLLDCTGQPITPVTLTHATVDVMVPILVFSLSPEATTIGAGESVEIDAFIENAANLRLYEVMLDVAGGGDGSLELTDLSIDEGRSDFVFAGISPLACITDPENLRIACTPLSDDCVDVPAGVPAYLGTYTFTANSETSASFTVGIVDEPMSLALDCDGNALRPFERVGATVNVDVPPPTLFVSPEVASIVPGSPVALDVFVGSVFDLRLYEFALEVVGGTTGSLDLTDLTIDEQRSDFVFAGISSLACMTDPDSLRITCTPLSDDCVDTPAGSPAYLGTYTFTASTDATGLFEIRIMEEPATFLLDCEGDPISPFALMAAVVDVDCNNGSGSDCNANGIPDDCDAIGSGDFDADGDVDVDDYRYLADCMAGPDEAPAPSSPDCVNACREGFDLDADADVDMDDFLSFQSLFTGVH